jgi:DNA-binding response OmpR family regulator
VKFLIADDDRVFVELCATRLRTKGHKVLTAVDAMQAFMFAMREQPDAIVLDINMPAGGGQETLRKLKTSAKTEAIPVIIVSGLSDPKLPDTVKQMGAAEFLAKPASFDQINATLGRLLGAPPV